jgi:hypothetical protein
MCIATEGSAGTWEIQSSPRIIGGARVAGLTTHPGPAAARRQPRGSKPLTQPWYRQAKEYEARREGWPEVLASE